MNRRRPVGMALALALVVMAAGCESGHDPPAPARRSQPSPTSTRAAGGSSPGSTPTTSTGPAAGSALLPGIPPPLDPQDVYAADRPGQLSRVVRASGSEPAARALRLPSAGRYSLGHTGVFR